jgi:DNA-binding response OmpR family regulator
MLPETLYPPRLEAGHDDGDPGWPHSGKDGPSGLTATVLYVDDNESARDLVIAIMARITDASFRVLTASTADEGIEIARTQHPDIILLDICLPGKSGYAALAELRRLDETRGIPVFALTTAAATRDINHGLAAGFDCYVTKPFAARDLVNAIIEVLEAVRRADSGRKP